MSINFSKLLISIGLCLGAGVIGSFFTLSSISIWYESLNKPVFNPPNYVFGPVWTLLYILMGLSLYLVWTNTGKNKQFALWVFFTQLVLNILWSLLFFGFQNPLLAFFEIIILWGVILLTIKYFYQVSKTASYLLIPYFIWVTFASILNLSIVVLN